jgi:hypothetical protein
MSVIVVVNFIGGGNRSTLRKPLTCRNYISHWILYHSYQIQDRSKISFRVDNHTMFRLIRPICFGNQFYVTTRLTYTTSTWARFELTTLVMIGANLIGSCKSNYHTITTTTMTTETILMIYKITGAWRFINKIDVGYRKGISFRVDNHTMFRLIRPICFGNQFYVTTRLTYTFCMKCWRVYIGRTSHVN